MARSCNGRDPHHHALSCAVGRNVQNKSPQINPPNILQSPKLAGHEQMLKQMPKPMVADLPCPAKSRFPFELHANAFAYSQF
mmetsp:Transcript_5100/g.11143  ORF Transcript_5100/g.11143 Transcript_5100/m.11143 type:complete len:82 (-) Transcript_5100:257-502(-)